MRRRRLRKSTPIPREDVVDPCEQPTIPLNIVPVEDWRTDSDIQEAHRRITWGALLAVQERIIARLGNETAFIEKPLEDIVRRWYDLGGLPQHITHDPLILAQVSRGGVAPLILISAVALAEMVSRVELANRLKMALEQCAVWVERQREQAHQDTALLLLDNAGHPLAQARILPSKPLDPPSDPYATQPAMRAYTRQTSVKRRTPKPPLASQG